VLDDEASAPLECEEVPLVWPLLVGDEGRDDDAMVEYVEMRWWQ
jgi:hypothetical protein